MMNTDLKCKEILRLESHQITFDFPRKMMDGILTMKKRLLSDSQEEDKIAIEYQLAYIYKYIYYFSFFLSYLEYYQGTHLHSGASQSK